MKDTEFASTDSERFHWPGLMVIAIIWSAILGGLLSWEISRVRDQSVALAANEAQAYFNKDKAFRLWVTSHGGIYVPADARTPPNPYLSHIPERDVTTPSGRKLTLMNPAYALRQMMDDYSQLYGVRGKITSFPDKLLNPDNMPDPWELDALHSFRSGVSEISDIAEVNGAPHFRLMRPLFTDQGCLKCHAFQGYKSGELRGGVGVSVPMAPYLDAEQESIHGLYANVAFLWVVGLVAIATFSQALGHKRAVETQRRLNVELGRLAAVDGLTGIANRRTFDAELAREWRRAQRNRNPLSLIMIDIDLFKKFNDSYGHLQGDECLRRVAQALTGISRRASDVVARYGGEEFAILLPETTLEQALLLAEQCRNRVIRQQTTFDASATGVVTISLGVGCCVPDQHSSPVMLIKAADSALYQAKRKGRNRVEKQA